MQNLFHEDLIKISLFISCMNLMQNKCHNEFIVENILALNPSSNGHITSYLVKQSKYAITH